MEIKVFRQSDGVGMDEYIIRNYLSVAGKSYYNSEDFEKEGFKMDPISRFGIGVLSCFMLSDYIEITTNRDPYISKKSEKLKITIPSKKSYFRIEQIQDSIDIGTTYKVYVLKDKLVEYEIEKLNIVTYVKKIAGFVDFPIEIKEGNRETTIVKPSTNKEEGVHSSWVNISYDFPIKSAIVPQNISTVKEYFVQKKILLKEDLGLDRMEGCLTFLLPKDENIDITNIGRSWPICDVKLINVSNDLKKEHRIQWKANWVNFESGYRRRKAISLSINKTDTYSVFVNGILLPNASSPEISPRGKYSSEYGYNYNRVDDCFLVPQLIVNVPKSGDIKIDLARSTMKMKNRWDEQIWEALINYLKENDIKNIIKKDNKERYFQIGRLSTFYRLTSKILLEKVFSGGTYIPIPFLTTANGLKFSNVQVGRKGDELRIPGKYVKEEMMSLFESEFINYRLKYSGFLDFKEGSDILAISNNIDRDGPVSLINVNTLIKSFIKKYFVIDRIEFIKSPLGVDYPWIQEVCMSKENSKSLDVSSSDISFCDITTCSAEELLILYIQLKDLFPIMPIIVKFDQPYKDKLFYSWRYMNRDHMFTKFFIDLLAKVYQIKKNEVLEAEIYGEIIDKINTLPFMDYYSNNNKSTLSKLNNLITEISNTCTKYLIPISKPKKITYRSFVKNSFYFEGYGSELSKDEDMRLKNSTEKWGELIK